MTNLDTSFKIKIPNYEYIEHNAINVANHDHQSNAIFIKPIIIYVKETNVIDDIHNFYFSGGTVPPLLKYISDDTPEYTYNKRFIFEIPFKKYPLLNFQYIINHKHYDFPEDLNIILNHENLHLTDSENYKFKIEILFGDSLTEEYFGNYIFQNNIDNNLFLYRSAESVRLFDLEFIITYENNIKDLFYYSIMCNNKSR